MPKKESHNLRSYLGRVLEHASPDLLPDEILELTDKVESSLAAYALQAQKDEANTATRDELKRHRQDTLEKSIAISVALAREAAEREPPRRRAEKRVRGHLKEVLEAADIGLTEGEVSKIEERMIRLFDIYTETSNDFKDAIYRRGEDEVLAVLEPPAKTLGANAY